MILLIDNFDSFTYNLQNLLKLGKKEVLTIRYDRLDLEQIWKEDIKGIVISPGPGRPSDYPLHKEIIGYAIENGLPLLGVCLGFQSIGTYFGASLKKAVQPMHGKLSNIHLQNHLMYEGIHSPTTVTRYHSLILENLPNILEATSQAENGELMSFAHQNKAIWGIQFHPEAHLTTFGEQMIENWNRLQSI